jgi:hypothetical protein
MWALLVLRRPGLRAGAQPLRAVGGDATLLLPANFVPRCYYDSAFKSRFEHCG